MLAYITIYLILALIAATLATILAHVKHRTWLLWGIMSMFFPPLVLLLIFLPKRTGPAPYEKESMSGDYDDDEKDESFFRW